jgi:hypothetical protein
MSITTPDECAAPEEAPDPSVARAERRLRLLQELAEIGMELARALTPGAEPDKAAAGEAPGKDPAVVYAPLSRAIRLTLALEARTDKDLRDLKAGVDRARQEARTKAEARNLEALEDKVRDLVLDVAERECESFDAFEDLERALGERLDEDEAYLDFRIRPLRQTVERLCHDLGLTPDWSRWAGEGWATDEPPIRPRYSPFHQPSSKPLRAPLTPASGGPSERPPPAYALE